MKPQDKGYRLPAVVNPPGHRYVCVPIPDDQNHILAFLGQLDMLAYWWTWQRDAAKTGKEVARVWREIVETVRYQLDNGIECDMQFDIRVTEECLLQKSEDGGETWQTIADLSECAQDGEPGQDGRSPEIRMSQVTETRQAVQWKYTDEPETAWRTVGFVDDGAPGQDGADGQSVTSVTVTTLAAGADATADYNPLTGALELGIPRGADGEDGLPGQDGTDGQGINEVFIETLDSGVNATADYDPETGTLVLGIPRGADGADCDCPPNPSPPPREDEPNDALVCGIAYAVTNELERAWDIAYENEGNFLDGLANGTASLFAVAAIIFPGAAIPAAGAAILIEAVRGIYALISAGEQNSFDEAANERYRCLLLCILNGRTDITSAVLAQWANEIEADTLNPQAWAIAQLLRGSPPEVFQWAAYVAHEVNPAVCSECECDDSWCYTWDFTTTNGDFFSNPAANPVSTWTAGIGWEDGLHSPTRYRDINILRDFSSAYVTSITFVFNVTVGQSTENTPRGIRVYNNGELVRSNLITDSTQNGTNLSMTLTVDAMIDQINLVVACGNAGGSGDPGGTAVIKSCTVQGTGNNPFGEDNCELV